MKEFASLEEIYDNLDQVADIPVRGAGKLAAKLIEHREAAFFARRLTEIACNMPLEIARTRSRATRARRRGAHRLLRPPQLRPDAAPAGRTARAAAARAAAA